MVWRTYSFFHLTYFEPLFLDSICMVDGFIVILYIRDPIAAFLQLTGRHSLDHFHFVWSFKQCWVKLCGDTGEALWKKTTKENVKRKKNVDQVGLKQFWVPIRIWGKCKKSTWLSLYLISIMAMFVYFNQW